MVCFCQKLVKLDNIWQQYNKKEKVDSFLRVSQLEMLLTFFHTLLTSAGMLQIPHGMFVPKIS